MTTRNSEKIIWLDLNLFHKQLPCNELLLPNYISSDFGVWNVCQLPLVWIDVPVPETSILENL